MPKAIWEGAVLAESIETVIVENNHYFPAPALRSEFFRASNHTTVCSWKGTANYFDIEVNGKRNANAAWYYPEPSEAAKQIRGRVAFWKGVKVEA